MYSRYINDSETILKRDHVSHKTIMFKGYPVDEIKYKIDYEDSEHGFTLSTDSEGDYPLFGLTKSIDNYVESKEITNINDIMSAYKDDECFKSHLEMTW